MKDELKERLQFLPYMLAGLGLTVIILFWTKDVVNIARTESAKEVFGCLCDALAVPGVILAGLGLLIWAASRGAYDIFGYAVHSFILPFRKSEEAEQAKTYYEYTEAMDKKGRKWNKSILFVGLGFLAAALICLIVYYLL